MPVAMEFFLDESSAGVVRQIWREIAEAGISPFLHTSGVRPHLTLAVGETIDGSGVDAVLRRWAAQTAPLSVSFASLGPTPTESTNRDLTAVATTGLLRLHAGLHEN